MSVERRRYAPHAAVAVGPLFDLIEIVFLDAVRRVGDNRMDAFGGDAAHPFKTVGMEDMGVAYPVRFIVEGQF